MRFLSRRLGMLSVLLLGVVLIGCGGGGGSAGGRDDDRGVAPLAPLVTGSISGLVTGSGGIPSVNVTARVDKNGNGVVDPLETYVTITGSIGDFLFDDIPMTGSEGTPLRITLHFEKAGYASNALNLEVTDDTVVNVRLKESFDDIDDDLTDGFQFTLEEIGGAISARAGAKMTRSPLAETTVYMMVTIEQEDLPPGVTTLTGHALWVNPVTDSDLFPGGFMASAGSGEVVTSGPMAAQANGAGEEVVMLESIVLSELVLEDQDGERVDKVNAELLMLVPRETWRSLADVDPDQDNGIQVPLYWFDKEDGLWKTDGQLGTLIDVNEAVIPEADLASINDQTGAYAPDAIPPVIIYAKGDVDHFTWWNVDYPIELHTSISGRIVYEEGGPGIAGIQIIARGNTYSGDSLALTDSEGYFAVDVMRSTGGTTQYDNWRYGWDFDVAPIPAEDTGGTETIRVVAYYNDDEPLEDDETSWSDIGTPNLQSTAPGTEAAPSRYIGQVVLPGRTISGRVLKEDLTPLSGLRVVASPGTSAETGADGTFSISAPVGIEIVVYLPGYFSRVIPEGEDDVPLGDLIIENNPPVIERATADPSTPNAGDPVELSATATDLDALDVLEYTWFDGEGNDIGSGATVPWAAPDADDGAYSVIVVVSDGIASDSAIVTVIVGDVDLPPADALAYGLNAMENGDVLSARDFLGQAVADFGSTASNDADIARFSYAVTRVLALWFDMESDGNPNNGLNTMGDILDAFGCDADPRDPMNFSSLTCYAPPSKLLANDSPVGADLQNFAYDIVRPQIEGAIANLNAVSNSFNIPDARDLAGPFLDPEEEVLVGPVEVDYAEVLLYRAGLKGALAGVLTQQAHNLDADIDAVLNDVDASGEILNTTEEFFDNYPDFLTFAASASLLSSARSNLSSAADDLTAAINSIESETDDQTDDLVNLLGTTPAEIAEELDVIAMAKALLNGQTTVDDNDTPDTSDDTIANLDPFFGGSVDIRDMLPPFVGNDIAGLLPDTTFGGILIQVAGNDPVVLNTDLDGDNVPDIFQEDLYRVYGGDDVSGDNDPDKMNIARDPEAFGFVLLGGADSGIAQVDFDGAYAYYLVMPVTEDYDFDDHEAEIDAFAFPGAVGGPLNWWNSPWLAVWFLAGPPDGWTAWFDSGDYILIEAPAGATGITVYGGGGGGGPAPLGD